MPLILFDPWWWTEHGFELKAALLGAAVNDTKSQPDTSEILDDAGRFAVGVACPAAMVESISGAALVIMDTRTAADHPDEVMARLRLLVEQAQTPPPDWEDCIDIDEAIRDYQPPDRPPPDRDHGR